MRQVIESGRKSGLGNACRRSRHQALTSKREAFFDDETFKAGLSKTLKKTMQDAVQSAMKDPSMLERLEPLGVQPIGSSSADLASTIKTQIAQYTQVAKEANIVIDQ